MRTRTSKRDGRVIEAGHFGPVALVAGESLVDVVRAPGRAPREFYGGSPANVALGLARLNRSVRFATWYGRDARGALLKEHLTCAGVHLLEGSDGAEHTSTALANIDHAGRAEYTFDLDWSVPPIDLNEQVHVVHFGSIGSIVEPGASEVVRLLQRGSRYATISYDPNVRPDVMGDVDVVRPQVESLVVQADVVKVSDEDMGWLYPGSDPIEIARAWADAGPAFVVLTRGHSPSVGVSGKHVVEVCSEPVQIVDTVGAGDSFAAAMLDYLWQVQLLGAPQRQALHRLGSYRLRGMMEHAAAASAITVSRHGADLPTRAELERVVCWGTISGSHDASVAGLSVPE